MVVQDADAKIIMGRVDDVGAALLVSIRRLATHKGVVSVRFGTSQGTGPHPKKIGNLRFIEHKTLSGGGVQATIRGYDVECVRDMYVTLTGEDVVQAAKDLCSTVK